MDANGENTPLTPGAVQVAPAVPAKPIRSKKSAVIAFCVVVALYLVIRLAHTVDGVQKAKPAAGQPASASAQATQSLFSESLNREAKDLIEKRQKIQATAAEFPALVDVLRQLPECNDAQRTRLAGQYFVAVGPNGQTVKFACDATNQWIPIPVEAETIQSTTRQQESALRSAGGTANDGGQTKKQKAEAARQAALDSTSVALDFASSKPVAGLPATLQARAAPEADAIPDDATEPPAALAVKKYGWNSSTGPLYRIFEGDVIETILTNRLAGEFSGPVNVMVTTNVYSHDRQHILIPQGTRILGESTKVSMSGQRRLAVVFHRAIMPDGYSVDFDKFAALDQQGATGLTGKVDTHWKKLIGTAVLLGAVGGLAQIGSTGRLTTTGQIRLGVGQQTGQEATQILQRGLNMLPTVTIYEGTRVRIWVQVDATLPAYDNHTVSPSL